MLASISPLGERARGSRWSVTVVAHVLGSTAGGLFVGGVAGLVGSVVPIGRHGRGWLLAAVLAVTVSVELVPALRLPTVRRQVDEDWLGRYRGWVYGIGYGFQLGLGVVTIVTTAAIYATMAAAALSGSLIAGAVVGGAFGATRGLVVLSTRRSTDADHLRGLHRRMQRLDRQTRRWAVATELMALAAVGGAIMLGPRP